MKKTTRKFIKSVISAILAITCVFTVVASASGLSWKNCTGSTKFNVHVASTSLLNKSATITIKNASTSENAIYVTLYSSPSNLSVYKGTGSGLAFNKVTIYPGGSAKITICAKRCSSGIAKFQVTPAGGTYSFSVSGTGSGYQSMGKCL